MTWGYVAVGAATLIGGYMSSEAQSSAASSAAQAQQQGGVLGIAEQQYEFNRIQKLLKPYTEAGYGSLGQQQALLGLQGPEAQQAAISGIESSPYFGALTRQGENAILQNAAATGGLRGGNVQAALAQFRPNMLSQAIQQRFQNLGSLTGIGQSSAAGVGAAAQNMGNNITSLLQGIGSAQAGNAIAQGQAAQTQANTITQLGGLLGGYLSNSGGF